jgi:dCTP deaminase
VSVLSDRDIAVALKAGRIKIEPYDPVDLQPSSVDLHLDGSFTITVIHISTSARPSRI